MSERRPIHDKLFRAVVVMGAALGAAACFEHGKSPPQPLDAKLGPVDIGSHPDGAPVDVIVIL